MPNFDALIRRLLDKYPNNNARDNNARGKAFEPICKWVLEQDPYYGPKFRNVWLWNDWPEHGKELGIDLVAETVEGKLIAVQAKCYSGSVPMGPIAKFTSASRGERYAGRLLIVTSDITENAEIHLTGCGSHATGALIGVVKLFDVYVATRSAHNGVLGQRRTHGKNAA